MRKSNSPQQAPRHAAPAALAACVLLLAPFAAPAQFAYEAANGAVTITGRTGTNAIVAIPATIEGLPVTRIGDFAFYFQQDITGVSIPPGVTNIGNDAFEYCTGLASLMLGDDVQSLGDWAFNGCSGLTNIALPARLDHAGDYAFANCSRLPGVLLPSSMAHLGAGVFASCSRLLSIGVAAGNPSFRSVDGVLFDQAQSTLVQFPAGRGGSFAIPVGVSRIADSAFDGARTLAQVTVPEGVADVGNGAFSNCRSLPGITLPASLARLGSAAFSYCTNLTTVDLPGSLAWIGDGPFTTCYNLTAIRVGPGNPAYRSVDGLLFNLSGTRLIQYPPGRPGACVVPEGVTNIGYGAFMGARGLTLLVLPGSLESLGDWVCANCTSLTAVTIPGRVRELGGWSFHACTSLSSLTLGTNLARIGDLAFLRCRSLTNVTLPSSLESLGSMAFYGGENLAGLFFQGPPPTPGADAFAGCPRATAYYLPGLPGWGTNYASLPVKLWNPSMAPQSPGFGIQGGHFGFAITGTPDIPVVVEASTALQPAVWQPLQAASLTNGQFFFRDPEPSVGTARFYHIRSP